jgi:flagellar hook-length control protein FliK
MFLGKSRRHRRRTDPAKENLLVPRVASESSVSISAQVEAARTRAKGTAQREGQRPFDELLPEPDAPPPPPPTAAQPAPPPKAVASHLTDKAKSKADAPPADRAERDRSDDKSAESAKADGAKTDSGKTDGAKPASPDTDTSAQAKADSDSAGPASPDGDPGQAQHVVLGVPTASPSPVPVAVAIAPVVQNIPAANTAPDPADLTVGNVTAIESGKLAKTDLKPELLAVAAKATKADGGQAAAQATADAADASTDPDAPTVIADKPVLADPDGALPILADVKDAAAAKPADGTDTAAPATDARQAAPKADADPAQSTPQSADPSSASTAKPAGPSPVQSHPTADPGAIVVHPTDGSAGQSPNLTAAMPATQGPAAPATVAQQQVQAAAVPVPLNGLALEISARAKAGSNRFDIRLDPPELGRIDVQLHVSAHGQVTSHLIVDRPETLDLLRRDAPNLQRSLQDAGLTTGDNALQFSLRDQSFSGGNGGDNNSRPTAHVFIPETESVGTEIMARSYRRAGQGSGVDIRV